MAIYGIVSYDIKAENHTAAFKIPAELSKFCCRVTNSVWMFDWTFRDKVMDIFASYAEGEKVQPPMRINQDDENTARHWVRNAYIQFFDQVIPSLRKSIEEVEKSVKDDKLTYMGGSSKIDIVNKRIKDKIENAFTALATFRLTEEFADMRKTITDLMEAERESFAVNCGKILSEK